MDLLDYRGAELPEINIPKRHLRITMGDMEDDVAGPSRLGTGYAPMHTFNLPQGSDKQYQQQYGDMYFLRLSKLRKAVEEAAMDAWSDFEVAGERVQRKQRVLDIRQGELCWVVGTVYMQLPLKPNILEDISRDHWISAPQPKRKYTSPQDETMLEDESGRLKLVGVPLETSMLVTGCIIAAMGTENTNGEFEIIDLRFPDIAPQPERWASGNNPKSGSGTSSGGKVAMLSGLGITGNDADSFRLDLLMEYLLGEVGGESDIEEVAKISRLFIVGNSIGVATLEPKEDLQRKTKKYGYDASAYNPAPTAQLDAFMATMLPSLPITLIPGESDPANASLPQQQLHPAMFPHSRAYAARPDSSTPGWLDSVSNPWQGDVEGWRFLGNGGQPVDDIYKYVDGDDRLEMMEHLLRWRCGAPTAPDTLWCYPFQDDEPFVMTESPHLFFVGNQPRFSSTVIEGPSGQYVRLIALPSFKDSGQLVLVDLETLEVEIVQIEL